MRLFRREKESGARIAVVIDVGSASVGAGLVLLPRKGVPHVLYHTRADIVFQKELDFDRFWKNMLSSLEQVLEDIVRHGLPHLSFGKKTAQQIDHVLVTYASPWYVSRTKIVTHNENKPVVFARSMVDKLLTEQEEALEKEAQNMYEEGTSGAFEIVEKSVTNIELNGYRVEDPYGKVATDITFTLSITVMARGLRRLVEETIAKHLHANHVTHHSFALVGFTGVRHLFQKIRNFLLVDISGEVTDISVVSDGGLLESVSFPSGTHRILRTLMRTGKLSLHEAQSSIRLFTRGMLTHTEKQRAGEIIQESMRVWRTEFQESLGRFRAIRNMPKDIFVTVDNDFVTLFEDSLKEKQQGNSCMVHVLQGKALQQQVIFREGKLEDPFIALEAYYEHVLDR